MPITEDKFTLEELDAVLEKNPETLEAVKGALTKREYFLADKTEKSAYEENLKKVHNSDMTKLVAGEVEKTVEEITGMKKSTPQEKWTDYYKRVLTATSGELKTLREKTPSELSATEKLRLTELETLVSQKDVEIQTLKDTHQSESTQLKAESKINASTSKVESKLKKNPELQEPIAIVSDKVKEDMKKAAKFEDGKWILVGEDGKTMLNDKDKSVMTFEQYYEKRMEKYIDVAKKAGGAGGNGEGDPETTPGTIKNQYELGNMLASKGLVQGTKEFTKEFDRLGGSKLPMQ